MSGGISASDLQKAIMGMLEEYGDQVYVATEEGLDAAENVLIAELKAATPGSVPHRKNLAKGWKGTKRKYKLARFVGNSVTVKGKGGKEIPLTNVLEYSTDHGKPFIKKTFEGSIEKVAATVVAEIKKGV